MSEPALSPSAASLPSSSQDLAEASTRGPGGAWMDAALPWLISGAFHLGLLIIGIFVAYMTFQALSPDERPIIVPQSFEDPAYSENPGGIPNPGANADPSRQSAQDRLKELAKSEGWAQSEANENVAGLLGGQAGGTEAMGIFAGTGGSLGSGVGNDSGGGKVAAYGAPGGGGNGPRSSFYGTGGNAVRIVYILDHSGSMLDNFGFLREEAKRSVGRLVPLQYFSVILVSDRVTFAGASGMTRALPDAKKAFSTAIDKERAEGQNDDLLAPFQQAFEKAFAQKPDLIYFLTDGRFNDRLPAIVTGLNKDKKVHINTIAFVTEEPSYKGQLEQLAKDNGGSYKFIPEKELGR
jgi:hypothetical protein